MPLRLFECESVPSLHLAVGRTLLRVVLRLALRAFVDLRTGVIPLAAMVPVGRLGRSDEVAALAVAILENGYMTGQVVGIDGGMHPR